MFAHPCQERRAALCRAIVGPNLQIAAHSLVLGDAADLHPDAVSNRSFWKLRMVKHLRQDVGQGRTHGILDLV